MAIDFKNQTPKNTLPANGVIFGADDPNSTSPSTYTKSALINPNTVTSVSGGTTGLTPAVPTSGDVVISGTLAVANGGTGVTTKTGTGNVVLSDNPTLVSPVLGQPASGDLTNCTNLPLTTGITGVLGETHGGTGQSSYTIGDLLYASSTTALSKLPDAATGNALISGGVGAPPSWGKVGLTTHVDGTLPLANGGTGVTSLPALQTSIFPSQSGNSGKYLKTNGSSVSWADAPVQYIDNVNTSLRAVAPTAGAFADVGGYYASGDGGGGQFYAVTTGGPYNDNGGTIITFGGASGASSAWILIIDAPISVDNFGAKGGAKFSSGSGTIASGNNQFTFSVAVFTSNDIGKTINIQGAGAANGVLTSVITNVISSKIVTLADNAGSTLSAVGIQISWAFDDTAAFSAALAATTGEIRLNPLKSYAVNLVITKSCAEINGCTGGFYHGLRNNVYNLVPFDRSKPVIQISDDSRYVGAILLQNLNIYNPIHASTLTYDVTQSGNIGLLLTGGAYGNRFYNVSITNFTDHCLKIQGSLITPPNVGYSVYYNYFNNIQLYMANKTTAVLGEYWGNNPSGVTTQFFSQINIQGPSAGNGYTIITTGCEINISQGWFQWVATSGIQFNRQTVGAVNFNGTLVGNSLQCEGVSPSSGVICESTYDTTGTIPPVFGTVNITGSYKNASAVSTVIFNNNGAVSDKTLYYAPIFSGLVSLLKSGVTTTVMNYDGSGNFFVGQVVGTTKLQGDTIFFRSTNVDMIAVSYGSQYIRPQSDNSYDCGTATNRWRRTYSVNFYPGAGTAIWTSGTSDPTASSPVGSITTRTDPANGGPVLFVREKNTAGTNVWSPIKSTISGSATYDPPNLIDGDGVTTTLTVTGAVLGDFVTGVSFSLDLQGITVTGWVSAADTVSVRFQNETGGAIDLASGTLRAQVQKA